jgi:DNA-binding transcriptional LysR family regulator
MLSTTLRQLEYACAIARHGGLTAAALALHVSQPALSVALAQVERQLGQPLFLRRPGGPLVPTPFGRGWLAAAEAQLDAVAGLMSGAVRSAPLRLAMFEDLAPILLAPLLAETDLPLTPRVMGFEALTDALLQGQADIALTWDLGLPPAIGRLVLIRLPPQAVLAADHPLARRTSLTLSDLAAEPLVLTDQGLSIGHMRALFAQRGLAPRIAHRCATLDLMRSFAANGLGVGLSYAQPAPRESPDGKALVVVPVTDAGREPLVLAHPVSGADPPGHAQLRAILTHLLAPLRQTVAAIPQE